MKKATLLTTVCTMVFLVGCSAEVETPSIPVQPQAQQPAQQAKPTSEQLSAAEDLYDQIDPETGELFDPTSDERYDENGDVIEE